jgi:hypothetical protein
VGLCIGVDEVGLGPNLGPLVVVAVAWETPCDPRDFDFWTDFATAVTRDVTSNEERLIVADSKQVFQPGRGLRALERTVLAAWSWRRALPASLTELLGGALCGDSIAPWQREHAVILPHENEIDGIAQATQHWQSSAQKCGVQLRGVFARVVEPDEFNSQLARFDNKALVAAAAHQAAILAAWQPTSSEPALIVSDKHGGRNRYAGFLSEVTGGQWIETLVEGPEASHYRCGATEFRFEPRAERYGQVALASMTAKYLRELCMLRFNRFWQSRIPELRPTQGYPEDAKRFLADIADEVARLRIPREMLWRAR